MTIREKAINANLSVEEVVKLALATGIDVEDLDRKLSQPEAIKLGTAVKNYDEDAVEDVEPKTARFWTKAINHMILVGTEHIKVKGHVLVLDAERDKNQIALIRRLKNVKGSYCIYEVIDKPLDEDSDELVAFSEMLRGIMFTGGNGESSKSGKKALRAMFTAEELDAMGSAGFNPERLIMKVLRNKSLKTVSDNV